MVTPLKLGIIGYNEGNGHPFSFASIINGYDPKPLRDSGWDVIADYLDKQDRHDIGLPDAQVVSVWAPQEDIAKAVAATAGIAKIQEPSEMVKNVDGVLIARDDWESHAPLAMPFLEAGKFVFIDKPLTLDETELDLFEPYLRSGHLMSCSALRYARELDALRAKPEIIGKLQCVTGAVVLRFERYGIHLLEAVSGILGECPELLWSHKEPETDHAVFRSSDGVVVSLHALGTTSKRFRLSFYGDKGSVEVDISDNFSAFRRCIQHFIGQIRSGNPAIDPDTTLAIMRNVRNTNHKHRD